MKALVERFKNTSGFLHLSSSSSAFKVAKLVKNIVRIIIAFFILGNKNQLVTGREDQHQIYPSLTWQQNGTCGIKEVLAIIVE